MDELSKDNLLRSWKEIAAYLGCDIRTCHRWEVSHGMPVHRAEWGEAKSPVFAYKDELDAWFRETFKSSNGHAERPGSAAPGSNGPRREPACSSWQGRSSCSSGNGRALSRPISRSTGLFSPSSTSRNTSSGASTRRSRASCPRASSGESSSRSAKTASNAFPSLVIRDINGDGDVEVLFAPKRGSRDRTGLGSIASTGRAMKSGGSTPARSSSAGKGLLAGLPHPRIRLP